MLLTCEANLKQIAHKRHMVKIDGEGDRIVLFSHGLGCDQSVWSPILPRLQSESRTVTFDTTGAGGSDPSHFDPDGRHSDLEGYAEDLVEVCAGLNASGFTFVGHSVGAIIGLIAARRWPNLFSELILITPSPYYLNEGSYQGGFSREQLEDLIDLMNSNFSEWVGAVVPKIMGNPGRPEIAQELGRSFCRWNLSMAKHLSTLTFLSDMRSILPEVQNECLILQTSDDEIAPDFVGEYMSKQLSRSKLVRLAARGHCPHVSHPEETVQAIVDFLEGRTRVGDDA